MVFVPHLDQNFLFWVRRSSKGFMVQIAVLPLVDGDGPHDRLPYWCFTKKIPDRLVKIFLGWAENAIKSGIKFRFSITGS